MFSRRCATAICLFVFAGHAYAGAPARVILDTDLGPDCDDAGAVAVLHALANRGESEVLGTMCNTTSEWCAPALDAINAWYHRPSTPVGTLKGPGNPGGGPKWFGESYNRYLAGHWPNRFKTGRNAPDAVAVYRRLLAGSPDGSVAVVSVGNTTNLRNLLESKPDAASPLAGIDLVRRKVKLLSVMGGTYPRGKKEDPNLYGDLPASKAVLERWPTPIMFSGIEIGDRIKTGAALTTRVPADDPVRTAYLRWDGYFWRMWDKTYDGKTIRPHPSYDQTAVLYAVRGLRNYWTARTGGYNHLSDDGATEWRPQPDRGHGYLVERMPPDELARVIEGLMIEPPAMR